MNDTSLNRLLDMVWQHLGRGVADRKHPARHPTLASIGADGPELRTLVLRAATRETACLEMHTDSYSPKIAQIGADPRVALHIWLPKPSLQLRLKARAQIAPGDPAIFAQLPDAARTNYGGLAPGTPLDDPYPIAEGDAARFTRLLCQLHEIDVLHLDQPPRRALFTAVNNWSGAWIAP